jgi:hypothetical protein
MDMTSYFMGRNAAGNSSSGADFNIVEPVIDETFEDTDIYNANGMNGVINGILEMIDEIGPTLADFVNESISECERSCNKTNNIGIYSDENQYPNAKAVYNYGQQIAQSRQEILESGENIKTINGRSILGSGNLDIEGGSSSGEEWEHICDVSVVEDTENPITNITQDLGASYKKLYILINKNTEGGLVTSGADSYPLRIFADWHHNNNLVGMFGTAVTSTGWNKYSCEIDYNPVLGIITGWSSIGVTNHFKQVNVTFKSAIKKLIFVNIPHTTTGGGFKTFTINIYGVRE